MQEPREQSQRNRRNAEPFLQLLGSKYREPIFWSSKRVKARLTVALAIFLQVKNQRPELIKIVKDFGYKEGTAEAFVNEVAEWMPIKKESSHEKGRRGKRRMRVDRGRPPNKYSNKVFGPEGIRLKMRETGFDSFFLKKMEIMLNLFITPLTVKECREALTDALQRIGLTPLKMDEELRRSTSSRELVGRALLMFMLVLDEGPVQPAIIEAFEKIRLTGFTTILNGLEPSRER